MTLEDIIRINAEKLNKDYNDFIITMRFPIMFLNFTGFTSLEEFENADFNDLYQKFFESENWTNLKRHSFDIKAAVWEAALLVSEATGQPYSSKLDKKIDDFINNIN